VELFFVIAIFYIVYLALKEKYEIKSYALPGCMGLLEMVFWLILPIVILIVIIALIAG